MRVIIVGGGITGLAAAHRLLELRGERSLEAEVRVLEAAPRLGGLLATERRPGYVLELGPDSMITDKPWGLDLVRRLGLEGELIPTRREHRRAFVAREGRLQPVPEGFQILAPSRFDTLAQTPVFSWEGKCRILQDLILPRREERGDESFGEFVLRRLGREALERIAQPMVAGIYGADPMTLSLQATFPRFQEMEREHGSVILGLQERARRAEGQAPAAAAALGGGAAESGTSGARYGLFVSFRGGMQTLTDALAERLPDGCAAADCPVELLERSGERWKVRLRGGDSLEADAVILALPAFRSGELLRPVDAGLADRLEAIPYASAATVTLAYRREEVPHPLDGFGFVVPSVEKLSLLGCTFAHVKYEGRAPEGVALLRAFLGHDAAETQDDAGLERLARTDFCKLLGIEAAPLFALAWRGRQAMPQYHVGHLERVAEVEEAVQRHDGLALAGNSYRGVGIPDAIHSGEMAAERVLAAAGR